MRRHASNADASGQDSFLDVVANIVGILIILVMLVGVRVKNTPVTASISAAVEGEQRELQAELAVEQTLQSDTWELAARIKTVQEEALVRAQARQALATLAAALEQRINERRRAMATETRADFDLRRAHADAQRRLQQIESAQSRVEASRAAPIRVESYPTPLSRTVDDAEGHFQLRGGLLAYVPLQVLIDQLKQQAQHKAQRLRELPEITDTLGPVDGFRMRYTLMRTSAAPDLAMPAGYGGYVVRLKRLTLIPVADQLGEPLSAALQPDADFRRRLCELRPGRHVVTVWVYPDSFDEFRTLKKELYRLGFACAARPLREGDPISGSPEGTKSAAQ